MEEQMDNKLYVGNLSYRLTEDELRQSFSQAGTVVSVRIITDANTGRSKGFGFVEMEDQAMAEKAIETLNGADLQGRALKVAKAQPVKPRDRGGDRAPRY
jgi:RNA recognition motif-containing protein